MSQPAPRHLFVYGTLRDDPRHDMFHVLARSATFIGDGRVNAQLFDLGAYPGIVLSQSPGDVVRGELYRLKPEEVAAILTLLDDYEGLGPDDPQPHEYKREVVRVLLPNGRAISAWAYVLAHKKTSYPRIPAEDYLEWKVARGSA